MFEALVNTMARTIPVIALFHLDKVRFVITEHYIFT